MYDTIIIGAGPAGISASLYTKRANLTTLVIYYETSNLEKASRIDNYYGFPGGITGCDLFNSGIKQSEDLGVEIIKEQVVGVEFSDSMNFNVKTVSGLYEGKSVIIAVGDKKLRPNIKGVAEFEGKGVSYCAVCDGFFYRGKTVTVIGSGEYALSEAEYLSKLASKVIIASDGKKIDISDYPYEVKTEKITEIYGDGKLEGMKFIDGTQIKTDGVFIAIGAAGGADFAKTLGIILDGDSIKTDENMATNVPGIFSCGNVNKGLAQVCKAVYEGAEAGLSAVKFVRNKSK